MYTRSLAVGSEWLQTTIATCSLGGTLEDKLAAAATAGFEGIELCEPDLVASALAPEQVRARCADLGLSIDAYQPFRDFDSIDAVRFSANLRRAEAKFDILTALGAKTLLVVSAVSPDAVRDDGQLIEQLRTLADRAAVRGMKVAYEALGWGRYVNTWNHSWAIVGQADHPALGLCLDSFHILARTPDPVGIEDIDPGKLFLLQLADAPPLMTTDALDSSRHYRLFPGEGAFDLRAFLTQLLNAGYTGPLSVEVFNDVFRQADPNRIAVDARRSLLVLAESVSTTETPDPITITPPALGGYGFVEIAAGISTGAAELSATLTALGFTQTRHYDKSTDCWEQGSARLRVNHEHPSEVTSIVGFACESSDPEALTHRAERLYESTIHAACPQPRAITAPDGTVVYFSPPGSAQTHTGHVVGIDHIGFTETNDRFDASCLFYRSVLDMSVDAEGESVTPFGVVRHRAVADQSHRVRLAFTVPRVPHKWYQSKTADTQYIAFRTHDIIGAVRAARAAGTPFLTIPDNYYADLETRIALPAETLTTYRELGILYSAANSDGTDAYLEAATELLDGHLYLSLVERVTDSSGYGWSEAATRTVAHERSHANRPIAMQGRSDVETPRRVVGSALDLTGHRLAAAAKRS
ncbi:MAG: sugar phosphate isomerase/epimerase and 4-hydroxyphenylpyruvate domain-containing protein [Mycobacterium sp.]|nr:sugar phosphate isomerase/epimerase and 4-hydroxyphenylpyruvate domain-containing protein [Mycobacterium sp.]